MPIEMMLKSLIYLWLFLLLPICFFGFIRYVFLKQILQSIRGKGRDSDLE